MPEGDLVWFENRYGEEAAEMSCLNLQSLSFGWNACDLSEERTLSMSRG